MGIVQLTDVKKVYPLGKTEVQAVRGVSFTIEEGDFMRSVQLSVDLVSRTRFAARSLRSPKTQRTPRKD